MLITFNMHTLGFVLCAAEYFLARSISNGVCTHLLPQVEQNEPKIFSQSSLFLVESESELANSHLDDDGISADKPHVAVQVKTSRKHTHKGITKLAKMLSEIRILHEKRKSRDAKESNEQR